VNKTTTMKYKVLRTDKAYTVSFFSPAGKGKSGFTISATNGSKEIAWKDAIELRERADKYANENKTEVIEK
jgi:hypothetical protein